MKGLWCLTIAVVKYSLVGVVKFSSMCDICLQFPLHTRARIETCSTDECEEFSPCNALEE